MTEQDIREKLAAPLIEFIGRKIEPADLEARLRQTLDATENAHLTYFGYLYENRALKAASRFINGQDMPEDLLRREIIDILLEFREYAYHSDEDEEAYIDPEPTDQPVWKIYYYDVVGLYYHRTQLQTLSRINPDYELSEAQLVEDDQVDVEIPKYCFDCTEAELIPEPENLHDPHAIRVEMAGETIGYIKKGQTQEIQELLDEDRIGNMSCQITGGPFRILYSGYSPARDKAIYENVEKEQAAYKGELRLCVGPKLEMSSLVGRRVAINSEEHEKWFGRVYLYLESEDDIKGQESLLLDVEGVPTIYRIPLHDILRIEVLDGE